MSEDAALYTRQGRTGIITLNRPHRLNAINVDLLTRFMDHLDTARRDKEVTVVVLTGAGRAFCAGEDLKETSAGKTAETWEEETERLQDIQRLILGLGKPLIAAVNGYAVGGGCEFAMSCDIRIAGQSAVFGFPETGIGLTVTTAGTKLLSQLIGLGKAKELIFTGRFIQAEEAERIGLANLVVPDEGLLGEALAMADQISERSPLALRLSRIAIDAGLSASFEEILELEAAHLLTCAGLNNQSGLVEKRLSQMKQEKE